MPIDDLSQISANFVTQDASQVSETKAGEQKANAVSLQDEMNTQGRDDIASKQDSKRASLEKEGRK